MSTKSAAVMAKSPSGGSTVKSRGSSKSSDAESGGKSAKSDVIEHFGLDMGTSRIVMAKMRGEDPIFTTQLNAFVSLPFSKMNKAMLDRERIHYRVDGEQILAFGNRVDEFANILGGDTRRPMQTGLLNPNEPMNLEMIRLALHKLCGPASKGQRICFSVPSGGEDAENQVIFHEKSIHHILEDLGYDVRAINEGLAVVLAELVANDFTGVGISFGGGMCNVCLAYLGLPAVTFSTTRAGDFIDYSASSVTGETPTTVRLHKESEEFTLSDTASGSMDQALAIYYREVIQTVALTLERALTKSNRLPPFRGAIPVVFAGGSAMVDGFGAELEKAISRVRLPIEVSEIRRAEAGMNATAKGCLVAAMLEA